MNKRPAKGSRSRPSMACAPLGLLPSEVRLIAGQLRGSKLPVANRPGLRPTSDRVRETLFNWLQSEIAGRRVLDLFAGTGALGFEAASRGAAEVVLVERDAQLADSLKHSAARLKANSVRVEQADALAWLARPASVQFDLVFVDPPFALDLWQPAIDSLSPWLAPAAWVYLESGLDSRFTAPSNWLQYRQGQTREVRYTLYRVDNGQSAETTATLATTPAHEG